jgi:hypothetical protein
MAKIHIVAPDAPMEATANLDSGRKLGSLGPARRRARHDKPVSRGNGNDAPAGAFPCFAAVLVTAEDLSH